jgi:hypothetical protein
MDHGTYHGLFICWCTQRARMCAFAYFFTNYLQMCWEHTTTKSGMGYVVFMFTQHVHACKSACASERVVKHSLIFGRIISKVGKNYTTEHHQLHGLRTTHVHAPRLRVRARMCERARCFKKCSLMFGRIFSKFGSNILRLTTSYVLLMSTHRAHVDKRAC